MLKRIFIAIGIIGLIVLSIFIYHTFFSPKLGYVDVPKVFNSFEMKKELQEKFKKTESQRKRVLDSLSFDLQRMAQKLKSDQNNKSLAGEFDLRREYFFKKKSQTEEDNAALSNQYDKQILEQMSQYILDYGKENHYDLLLGADGNGTLLYANEKWNISEQVTIYINNKYKGLE